MSARSISPSLSFCLFGLLVASAIAFSVPAWAQSYAFVSSTVNLRAGPRAGYPVLYVLQPGGRVLVHGCLDDYSWCDVSAVDYRGWVYANYLDYNYDNRRVTIASYGPQIGIAVIAFSLMDYWSNHYRQRQWYRERNTYESRFGPHGERGREHRPRSEMPNRRPSIRSERPSQMRPQRQEQRQREQRQQMQQRQQRSEAQQRAQQQQQRNARQPQRQEQRQREQRQQLQQRQQRSEAQQRAQQQQHNARQPQRPQQQQQLMQQRQPPQQQPRDLQQQQRQRLQLQQQQQRGNPASDGRDQRRRDQGQRGGNN